MAFPLLSQGDQGNKGPQGFRGPKGDTVSAVKPPSAPALDVTFRAVCLTALLWLVPLGLVFFFSTLHCLFLKHSRI